MYLGNAKTVYRSFQFGTSSWSEDSVNINTINSKMDQNLWLLVEWMDSFEQNIFSNYAIVNTDSLMRHDPDIHTGKVVVLRDKHNNPRKAQVLRFSGELFY